MHLSRLLAALAIASVPAVAHAQPAPSPSKDLAFKVVEQSAMGGPAQAGTKVLTSATEYKAFLGHDAPASVDFSKDVVLAAAMGTKTSGGYSIEITRIELMTYGITGGMAFVDVVEKAPAPGSITTAVITEPFVAVKTAKVAAKFVFRNAPAPTPAKSFQKVTLETRNGSVHPAYRSTLSVDASGKFHFELGTAPPIDQKLSDEQLARIKTAFAAADVTTLPKQVKGPAGLAGGSVIELVSEVGGKSYSFSATSGFLGAYKTRVQPLVDALDQVKDELAAKPATKKLNGFVSVSGSTILVNENKSSVWSVENAPWKALLKKLEGQYVTGEAKIVKKGMFGGSCEVLSLEGTNDSLSDLNVRSAPKVFGSKTLGKIKPGDRVVITGVANGSFYEVSFNGKKGYAQRTKVQVGRATLAPVTSGITGALPPH